VPLINPADHLDLPTSPSDPSFGLLDTISLFIVFGFLCLLEVDVIRWLWFGHGVSSDAFAKFGIPVFVLLLYLLALGGRMTVRKLSKAGEIQPSVTTRIHYVGTVTLLMAYLAMQELVRAAFR
jgi:hypothetical protein